MSLNRTTSSIGLKFISNNRIKTKPWRR